MWGEEYILELFHGPTLAFKDLALALLPHLIERALELRAPGKTGLILTATSGDTGKAALESFAGHESFSLLVFFPWEGVSKIQKMQMITQEGDNLKVVAIRGDFDDAQRGVKEIFEDRKFLDYLLERNIILTSANSINIARLLPQIVYYFYSYLELVREKEISLGDRVNFAVPSGNFGNILAGYYAKKMGLPVNKLICASNDNRVLSDFFRTKTYDR